MPARAPEEHGRRLWLIAVVVVVFVTALGVSYLDEDAFISFRVVDNFVHGYGLRWNVDERVQVFTNPLWVLALIPLQAILPDISWASYLLSAVASTLAVAVVARRSTGHPMLLVLGFLLPLLLSQAFTDYTNSGLENPFVYLFGALFVERLMRHSHDQDKSSEVPWFHLSLFAALGACTRLDSFLMFAPALAWLCLTRWREIAWAKVALGAAPLLAWLGFALFYYGTVFPNPKYAKLNGGIPIAQYWKFGRTYLLDVARNDVVTFAGLLAVVVAALIGLLAMLTRGPRLERLTRHQLGAPATMLGCGVALYVIYVVYVGGDFMAGRHWAAPFFVGVCTLVLALRERLGEPTSNKLLVFVVLLLGLRFGLQPITAQKDVMERRGNKRFAIVRDGEIRDQRFNASFYETLFGARGPASKHEWSVTGIGHANDAAQLAREHPEQRHVVVLGGAGKGPYFAGPSVVFVDRLGLADALIARLPDADGKILMIGHLRRKIPHGYVHARQTGDLSQLDPQLRPYYEALRSITSDPLFDPGRLRHIWAMNTGVYDAQLQGYIDAGYREQKK